MQTIYLLLGSNLGDSVLMLKNASLKIENELGELTQSSSFYKSPPWGFEHDNDFVNQVLQVQTSLSPLELLKACLSIEKSLGRERKDQDGYAARKIDIDILFYADRILDSEALQLPHPRMHLRRFTLLPLAEISDSIVHPIFNKSVGHLLLECEDFSVVEIVA